MAIKIEDVAFTVTCESEYIPIRGNCMASGDDAFDEACAVEIETALEKGNPWAWCAVKVEGEWEGLSTTRYLGACSYESEADFCEPGGYFDDMKNEIFEDLKERQERKLHPACAHSLCSQNYCDTGANECIKEGDELSPANED
jgi:hypothetical protein